MVGGDKKTLFLLSGCSNFRPLTRIFDIETAAKRTEHRPSYPQIRIAVAEMNQPLSNKIAFITGGARGIGRAVALKLAAAGCDVAIAYHNSHEEAGAVCKSIRDLGRRAMAVQ